MRKDAVCPICESRERHRLAWLFFERRTDLFRRRHRMLHVSPEPELVRRLLQRQEIQYISVDITRSGMIQADVGNLPFPSASFDIIYCSHVLNMLADDAPAMRELARVLMPGGWAVIQVPLNGRHTIEYPRARTAVDKPADHPNDVDIRRRYGSDVKQRLEKAGFRIGIEQFAESLLPIERYRFGVSSEDLLVCSREEATEDNANDVG